VAPRFTTAGRISRPDMMFLHAWSRWRQSAEGIARRVPHRKGNGASRAIPRQDPIDLNFYSYYPIRTTESCEVQKWALRALNCGWVAWRQEWHWRWVEALDWRCAVGVASTRARRGVVHTIVMAPFYGAEPAAPGIISGPHRED
jgi:hypothetical protein